MCQAVRIDNLVRSQRLCYNPDDFSKPEWRNWQTRWTQNPVLLTESVGSTPSSGILLPLIFPGISHFLCLTSGNIISALVSLFCHVFVTWGEVYSLNIKNLNPDQFSLPKHVDDLLGGVSLPAIFFSFSSEKY